jgi:hypothetical protein
MVNLLAAAFPGLAKGDYHISSPRSPVYNCIAWAANDTTNWWWPGPNLEDEYWPPGIVREPTINAFQAAFESIGYVRCADENLESGFEKIALFADAQRKPKHGARQLQNGRWTSKLGECEDIEHALHDLEGTLYGSVVLLMKRPLPMP